MKLAGSTGKAPIISRKPVGAIADAVWRTACYDSGGVVERLSIIRPGPRAFIANGYRLAKSGPFGPCDIARLETHAALLMAALDRHEQIDAAAPRLVDEADLAHSLMAPQFGLSVREAEISAAMMLGETQEQIADRKHISLGSVVTYRRRAYGKLGINNRRDLQRLHHRLLAAPCSSSADQYFLQR